MNSFTKTIIKNVKKRLNKGGQTEILGLLVIVVLFVVIIGIVVMLSISGINNDSNDLRKNLQAHQLADAILQYTPTCDGEVQKDMRTIIKQCDFTENTETCGKGCKDLITDEAENIVRSLTSAGISYGIVLEKGEEELELSTCEAETVFADVTNDPAFTFKVRMCIE